MLHDTRQRLYVAAAILLTSCLPAAWAFLNLQPLGTHRLPTWWVAPLEIFGTMSVLCVVVLVIARSIRWRSPAELARLVILLQVSGFFVIVIAVVAPSVDPLHREATVQVTRSAHSVSFLVRDADDPRGAGRFQRKQNWASSYYSYSVPRQGGGWALLSNWVELGVPFRCLHRPTFPSWRVSSRGFQPILQATARTLAPTRLRVVPFAFDTLCFAAFLAAVLLALLHLLPDRITDAFRLPGTGCPVCGYTVRDARRCAECGAHVKTVNGRVRLVRGDT